MSNKSSLVLGLVVAGDNIFVYGQGGVAFVEPQCSNLTPVVDEYPTHLRLSKSFPNPFNPRTIIRFSVPHQELVTLSFFDVAGRFVKTLVDSEIRPIGVYDIPWDGKYSNGRNAPAGSYFFRVKIGEHIESGRMTLLK